jgi:hypothetical protein
MQRQANRPVGYFYDFLALSGLFPKAALIQNRLFGAVKADFVLFKSAKVNQSTIDNNQLVPP